jgi:ATP-dependent Clp protease ATP-binding subunit ClpA
VATQSELLEVLDAAGREAAALRHRWLDPEHFLLALLRRDDVAAQALASAGLDYETVRADVGRNGVEGDGVVETSAATSALMGFARGVAAGVGADAVTSEHVLLALVWEARLDVIPADDVLRALRDAGATVPP